MAEYDAQPGRTAPPDPDVSAARLDADRIGLHTSLAGVAALVAGSRTMRESLEEIAGYAVRAVPGATGAGLILVPPADRTEGVVRQGTADFVGVIEGMQVDELDEGPAVSCMQTRRVMMSGSLGGDQRWPKFSGRVARLGVHSVLALPLVVNDFVVGAISCYAQDRDAFGRHAVELGAEFADSAAVAVYNAQVLHRAQERAQQLQTALRSRAVIDQAIGIIRSRSGISAAEAFEHLARLSQNEQTKLNVVAGKLVEEAARRARSRHSG
ncbi:MAG: GAF and ANTAR domain-containing protein [Mycobacterium sp.]|nr:GAF and ANTAR domain-containing protein [Mycobacterium sp.]